MHELVTLGAAAVPARAGTARRPATTAALVSRAMRGGLMSGSFAASDVFPASERATSPLLHGAPDADPVLVVEDLVLLLVVAHQVGELEGLLHPRPVDALGEEGHRAALVASEDAAVGRGACEL